MSKKLPRPSVMRMHFNILIISLLVLTSTSFLTNKNEDYILSVELCNFRSDEGQLFIFIYNYENQYPNEPYRYYTVDKKHLNNNRIMVNIRNLNKGNYAISVLDDENKNDDLDRFLGIPTEGYGFSNNIRPLLSLPDYNELLFTLDKKWMKLKLSMQYVL